MCAPLVRNFGGGATAATTHRRNGAFQPHRERESLHDSNSPTLQLSISAAVFQLSATRESAYK
jgi:hypothetical protein